MNNFQFHLRRILSLIIIIFFILNVNYNSLFSNGNGITTNFTLNYYSLAGSSISDEYGQYIKQALAPLGINVQIISKSPTQFIGDILHNTNDQPYDLAQFQFTQPVTPIPSFMWKFSTTTPSFGQSIYQLNNPQWQQWQVQDTGISTLQVNTILQQLEYALNLPQRQQYLNQFVQLYMTHLLYDYPIVTPITQIAMWNGYGGSNNALWDPKEGIMASRAFINGPAWSSSTPSLRQSVSNNTNLRLAINNPNTPGMFDPNQAFDPATADITKYMQTGLFTFDKNFNPHPSIAYQCYSRVTSEKQLGIDFNGDGVLNKTLIEWGYFMGGNANWAQTTYPNGTIAPSRPVDARDFVLAFDMYKNPNTIVKNKAQFSSIAGYRSETFDGIPNKLFKFWVYADQAKPDDYYTFGKISPLPYHLLGGTLTNGTYSSTVNDPSWNPQTSIQWKYWASFAGHSLVGPYDIVNYKEGQYYMYRERPDYWFPNEWDFENDYTTHIFAYNQLSKTIGVNLAIFSPEYYNSTPNAYYWAYLPSHLKPTYQAVKTLELLVIDDVNAKLLKFESGNIDAYSSNDGLQNLDDSKNSNLYTVKTLIENEGPTLLLFNLLNPNLKKLDVRLAIAYALDQNEFIKIHNGFAVAQGSPVWLSQSSWYNNSWAIGYNYNKARDLMRKDGYYAADSPYINQQISGPPVFELLRILGSNWSFIFSIIAIISFSLVKKRKFNLFSNKNK